MQTIYIYHFGETASLGENGIQTPDHWLLAQRTVAPYTTGPPMTPAEFTALVDMNT